VTEHSRFLALLGPTNTGKTHYAIERMLGHSSGMIGLPLRLLAREVYDRVVEMRGHGVAALITGEEKIIPKNPQYWICTVESMPLERDVAFMAIDEVQLAADEDRGHTFTQRLLNARGREETMVMGSDSIGPLIRKLVPEAEFETRNRFSKLSYAGPKKLSRLPRRSAIVAFSANDVYALAELIRRRKGGAAVVMGALSPRTRNAQVAMYQNGEVDYIVATDAIGMGLNMSINHVAFASLTKFDGVRQRRLMANEIAQIAGRAGRHMNDGTFGVISDGYGEFAGRDTGLDQEDIDKIESHKFRRLERLQWRNDRLDFTSIHSLVGSLEKSSDNEILARARESDDLRALKIMARNNQLDTKVNGPAAVELLWQVCQIPDFRKTMDDEHAELLGRVHTHLLDNDGILPNDWFAGRLAKLDRTDGDIDTLAQRIAHTRTWTYISNRADWLEDPTHWRGEARAIEDKLSDALHERLTERFVDKRSSILLKHLQSDRALIASVDAQSDVLVEGQYVGRLEGLTFVVDEEATGEESGTLINAAGKALRRELDRRVEDIKAAGDDAFTLIPEIGEIVFKGASIAKLTAGGDPLSPGTTILASDFLDRSAQEVISQRVQPWLAQHLRAVLGPLYGLRDELARTDTSTGVSGLSRGLVFQMLEDLGSLPRSKVRNELRKIEQSDRSLLRKLGFRFGEISIYMPALLKPQQSLYRLVLWAIHQGIDPIPEAPIAGLTSIPLEDRPDEYYEMSGFRKAGSRAVRMDMLEKVAIMAREKAEKGILRADSDMMSFVGCSGQDFVAILNMLGYYEAPAQSGTEPGEEAPAAKAPAVPTAQVQTQEEPTEETPAEPAAEAEKPAPVVPENLGPLYVRSRPNHRRRPDAPKARTDPSRSTPRPDKPARRRNRPAKDQDGQKNGTGQKRGNSRRPQKREPEYSPDSPFAGLMDLKKSMEADRHKGNGGKSSKPGKKGAKKQA
jgi:ATP-dependent RNA helicase SUPV3L1/SUV3